MNTLCSFSLWDQTFTYSFTSTFSPSFSPLHCSLQLVFYLHLFTFVFSTPCSFQLQFTLWAFGSHYFLSPIAVVHDAAAYSMLYFFSLVRNRLTKNIDKKTDGLFDGQTATSHFVGGTFRMNDHWSSFSILATVHLFHLISDNVCVWFPPPHYHLFVEYFKQNQAYFQRFIDLDRFEWLHLSRSHNP